MITHRTKSNVAVWLAVLALASPAGAGTFDSGSDGSDGAFNPGSDIEVDLSLAASAVWDTPSPVPGQGVFDADQWLVVFKYTTIDVPVGVTVTFKNHPSGAPVVWLATGNVSICGLVNLSGANGATTAGLHEFAEPGPGGFAGGSRICCGTTNTGGFGPGGGNRSTSTNSANAGGYGTAGGGRTYGNPQIIPLIGGSGGAARNSTVAGGGAGGGAIQIASSGEIVVELGGEIRANGGFQGSNSGGGSGGAIKLMANTISGAGIVRALGGNAGGVGRIRLEAFDLLGFQDSGSPAWTSSFPGPVIPDSTAPQLWITDVASQPVTMDPVRGIESAELDLVDPAGPVVIGIAARNIPAATTVVVRLVSDNGNLVSAVSNGLEDFDMDGILTATAQITFPSPSRSEIQLRANWTP